MLRSVRLATITLCALTACSAAMGVDGAAWWNARWRFRTTLARPHPYRPVGSTTLSGRRGDDTPRPVEVAVDFPSLLKGAGLCGEFDPASLRVVERGASPFAPAGLWRTLPSVALAKEGAGGRGREVPCAYRTEFDATKRRERAYLAWVGRGGVVDAYFDTKDRGIQSGTGGAGRKLRGIEAQAVAELLPPENLLTNPGFEDEADGPPAGWKVSPAELVRLGRFTHTTGERSLEIVVDGKTPGDVRREVTLSQRIDVRGFTGQEMVFEADLLAERAACGAPVSIELEQFREDGSRIPEYAVQPRWLTIELAQGQLVRFCERGRFSHEASSVNVRVRVRCYAKDADTRETVTGPGAFYTVWLDRLVVRPGERWPWPAASNGGFVEGALKNAPFNRGFEFTGQRRLAFNGASEGTLTARSYNHARSVHWGLQAGTLEFWCRPLWNVDDGFEHIFFESVAYMHRRQCRLRKLSAGGNNQLEFSIADAGATTHAVRGPAPLRARRWHHIAATWDFRNAHLRLFVDGKLVAAEGPGTDPWPSSLVAVPEKKGKGKADAKGKGKLKGMGIGAEDTRSLPMQAFIGGDKDCRKTRSAEAVLDELRISDVVRYTGDFTPRREEFRLDEHTRALFHFENERHGVHDSDDRFVRGHLACELPRQEEKVLLEVLKNDGKIERRMVLVEPLGGEELFEANRAENRLIVTRPFRKLPDPRFVEHRERRVERTVTGGGGEFALTVGGDLEPLMRSITWERVRGSPAKTALLPRWCANDNVVPFSVQSIAETLAPHAPGDAEKAFEAFKYSLQVTNYYDAHYCETLPAGRHRPRVSYTLLKALNIYPFDQCGPLNHTLRKLFLAVGISSNNASGTHHQFEQAFYRGSWRLFDLSSRIYWLNRDNTTVASRRGFEDDLYLKLRQGSKVRSALRGRKSRATFGTAERPHSMDFPLRPGERVSICWHNEGRWFEVTGDRKPIPLAKIPPYFGNGAIVYEPATEGEATELDNMAVEMPARGPSVLRAKNPAKAATLIYRAGCPYIFSDASVSGLLGRSGGAVRLSLSFDEGKKWTEVWHSPKGDGTMAASVRTHVTGRYAYWLKVSLAPGGDATVTGLTVRTTFVASPLALPGELKRGSNRIQFMSHGMHGSPAVPGSLRPAPPRFGLPAADLPPLKTVCRWVERHKSDLGVSLNAISFYLNGDETHRNLFVASSKGATPISVTLQGRRLPGRSGPSEVRTARRGAVSLEGLPRAWTGDAWKRTARLADPSQPTTVGFTLTPKGAAAGTIRGFDVLVRDGESERRVSAQVLVADAALVREAEGADSVTGKVAPARLPEASGASVMAFTGDGKLGFDFTTPRRPDNVVDPTGPREGDYALWLRARWERGSNTRMTLALLRPEANARNLRAAAMIGFTDWTNPSRAHAKMFAHFGEQYAHWAWYRIPDVHLAPGKHRLVVGARAGACFDALVLLPQNPVIDRAAMNLFQNWNYAPWQNPL